MIVERSSYPHNYMKCAKPFILIFSIIVALMLYNSEGRPLILFLIATLILEYLAFGISERYDRLNRPILYNINSDKIKFVYYNKKVKDFTFDSIKTINIIVTEIDQIELEIIDYHDESARMYSGDFEDFPNVFYSFITLAKNAEVLKFSSYIRRSKVRTELEDERDIMDIFKEKDQHFKRENLKTWKMKF